MKDASLSLSNCLFSEKMYLLHLQRTLQLLNAFIPFSHLKRKSQGQKQEKKKWWCALLFRGQSAGWLSMDILGAETGIWDMEPREESRT